MLSDEVWKAIEGIKKDDEYYDILENIKQNKYNMLNVEKLMRDTTTGDYTEYEIAQSIVYFVNLIEKQSKEIEELKKQLDLDNECEIALNSKIMDLEKEIEELKETKGQDRYNIKQEFMFKKNILQELLEERN